jgi:hypothetical protein
MLELGHRPAFGMRWSASIQYKQRHQRPHRRPRGEETLRPAVRSAPIALSFSMKGDEEKLRSRRMRRLFWPN